jgi:hypothetical protein
MSGKKHGAGTYKFTNGNVYTGQFELDKKHGHGTMHWENGNKCVCRPVECQEEEKNTRDSLLRAPASNLEVD